jgi:hypothetical protein
VVWGLAPRKARFPVVFIRKSRRDTNTCLRFVFLRAAYSLAISSLNHIESIISVSAYSTYLLQFNNIQMITLYLPFYEFAYEVCTAQTKAEQRESGASRGFSPEKKAVGEEGPVGRIPHPLRTKAGGQPNASSYLQA